MKFSRQEYWSGLPFLSPGDLLHPEIEPQSPALQAASLPSELPGKLKSCSTLCDYMDHSMPGFSVLHCLLEFAQIHVHWINDAIQPSYLLLPSSLFAFNLSQHQGLFQWVDSASGGQTIRALASESVPPMNIQCWFSLGLTDLNSLRVLWTLKSSPAPQFESIKS